MQVTGEFRFGYNPDGKPPEVPPLLAPEPYMRDLLEALTKAEEQIAASGWAPSNSNQGLRSMGRSSTEESGQTSMAHKAGTVVCGSTPKRANSSLSARAHLARSETAS